MSARNFFYAPSSDLIETAGRSGIGWAVIASHGHTRPDGRDDIPVLLKAVPEVAKRRKKKRRDIARMLKTINERIEQAHKHDMKAVLHAYELCLPMEIKELQDDYFVKHASEVLKLDPDAEADRLLCPLDERVQNLIEEKIAELVESVPELDAYMFSFHESQLSTYNHRCDGCKDKPHGDMVVAIYDAIRRGLDRAKPETKLIYRMWGTLNQPEHYYENRARLVDLEGKDESRWYTRRLPALNLLRFKPEQFKSQLDKAVREREGMVCHKATGSDYTLQQPSNRETGKFKAEEIVEISFEHCRTGAQLPFIVVGQLQALIREARDKGADHLCGVPVNWGMDSLLDQKHNRPGFHPTEWSFNQLNLEAYLTLIENPDVDLKQVAVRWLRHGDRSKDARKLAEALLSTEDVLHQVINVNGVSTVMNANSVLHPMSYDFRMTLWQTFRYAVHFLQRYERISPSDETLARIRMNRETAAAEADRLLASVRSMALSLKRKREAVAWFGAFGEIVRLLGVSRERHWTMLRLREGEQHPKRRARLIMRLGELIGEEEELFVTSEYLAGGYRDLISTDARWKQW